jgi:hypothetical protein
MDQPTTDFDGAWKEALERYLEPFLALCFPQAHGDIDWTTPPQFLDTELQQVAPDEPQGRQHVDKLVRIFRRGGDDAWVLVHVEVQSQRDRDFAQRMFRYHARLYDRYQRQVVSLAVLGDEEANWQPDRFRYGLWGCELALTFPVVKLLAFDATALRDEPNIFAMVILLHRDAQDTRHDPQERMRRKVTHYRRMLQRGHQADDVRALLRLMDRLLRLGSPLVQQARDAMKRVEEEFAVSYITSFEEIGIEQGRHQELARSILRTLRVRFGAEAADSAAPRLQPLSLTQLDALAEAALMVPSLDALLANLNEIEVEHGRAEGLIDGLALALELKFGAAAAPVIAEVRQITDLGQLEAIMAKIKTAESLDEVRGISSPPPEI